MLTACRHRVTRLVVAFLVAVGPAVAVGPLTRPVAAASTRPDVSIIGDSVAFALSWWQPIGVLEPLARYRYWIDAVPCRTTTQITSCPNLPGIAPATEILRSRGGEVGRVAVIVLGANESSITFGPGVRAVVAQARASGAERVLWLTVAERGRDRAIFAANNAVLREAASQDPTLVVADWNAEVQAHLEWTSGPDVHLNPTGARAMAAFIAEQADPLADPRCAATTETDGFDPGPMAPVVAATAPAGGLHLVAPERLVDTREGRVVGGQRSRRVPVTGRAGVPAGATGALVNLTAVEACRAAFLTAYDCARLPLASNLNVVARGTRAGAALAGLDADGGLCVFANERTDVIVDVFGWVGGADGVGIDAVAPVRLVDTRTDGRRLRAGGAVLVPVPGDATGAVINLTAVGASGSGFLTAYAPTSGSCGPRPLASNLNPDGPSPLANLAVIGLSGGGFCMFANIDTDVVIDLLATTSASASGRLSLTTPTRVLDTRDGTGVAVAGPRRPGEPLLVGLGAPADARGAAVVVTGVEPRPGAYVTVWPAIGGQCSTPPLASNLNVDAGAVAANTVIVGLPESGPVCMVANQPIDVVADVVAWVR